MATSTVNGDVQVYDYASGFALETFEGRQYAQCNAGAREARAHARNWRLSLDDHADTSYWGVQHCRDMCAFWLGVARAIRELG